MLESLLTSSDSQRATYRAAFAVVLSLGFVGTALATVRTSPPALDLKADLLNLVPGVSMLTECQYATIYGSPFSSSNFPFPITLQPYPPTPVSAPHGYIVKTYKDHIFQVGTGGTGGTTRYLAAAAYITYDDGALGTATMTITTIYGIDTNPTTPGALGLAGYNLSDPYPLLSGETFIGPTSGATYTAGAGQLVPISGLSSLLGSSADLSIFSGPTSNSVYVFRTQMPISEVLPEPTSLSFIGMGATACLTRRRRR